jgi:acyl-CoA synthetase (AMP-forming)/AMP-acid ligase II
MFLDSLVTRSVDSSACAALGSTRPPPQADQPAFRSSARTWTYAELSRGLAALAAQLAEAGVGRGDRVLIRLPSGPEFVLAVLATSLAGGIAVPLSAAVSPERLAYVAELTRPSVALASAGAATPPGLWRMSVCLEDLASQRAAVARHPQASPDDTAMVLFSSGSTGRPKGVSLTHKQLLCAARHLAGTYRFGAGHRELIVAPMCHSDGWQRAAASFYSGGVVAVSEGMLSVRGLLEDVRALGATGLFIPPPLVPFLVRTPLPVVAQAFASCRTVEIGSALFPSVVIQALSARMPGADLFLHYGLTECSRAVVLEVGAHADKLHTVGRPGDGVTLSVRDEAGRPVKANVTGQIFLCGPQQCTSYYGRPDLDAERFVDDWLATGDFGWVDREGFVTLLGRRDDMVTSGGHHFFPAEVETELGPVDGVADYIVAGVADPAGIMGQVLWAFVVPTDVVAFTPGRFVEAARRRLPPHMRPRRVVVVPELARSPSGKPDRRKMGAAYSG